MQTTSHLLMIRPVRFGFNAETAVNNAFQVAGDDSLAHEKALAEFEKFVSVLRGQGVDVTVVEDTPEPYTPDSVFPNNWVSFHQDGTLCLYPMYAKNRRAERKPHVLEQIRAKFNVSEIIDFSGYEAQDLFLEGTGSMILDREHRIVYACLSARTDTAVLEDFCRRLGYRPVVFHSNDQQGKAIYHTNVMMCIADRYAIVCFESVTDPVEREALARAIRDTGKESISISLDQVNHFAGNMLQVKNGAGTPFLVMSSQAYNSLSPDQIARIEAYNAIIHSPLDTIEQNGGGSARCMMAEVFLPLQAKSH